MSKYTVEQIIRTWKKGQSFDWTKISFITVQVRNSKNDHNSWSLSYFECLYNEGSESYVNARAYFFMEKVIKSCQLSTPIVLQFVLNPKLTNYTRFYWREYEFLQVLRNIEKVKLTACIIWEIRRNRFQQVRIASENIVKPILSMTFHVILGRPRVRKMKLLEKCQWRCSVIFIVFRFYCCCGRVSDGWDDPPVGLIHLSKQCKT